jgi:hypothetical protein
MPNGDAALVSARAASLDGMIDNTTALLEDPVFGAWVRGDGPRTYLRYLTTHPGYVLTTPFNDDEAYRSSLSGVTVYGTSRRVVPELVDAVYWPQSEDGRTRLQVLLAAGLIAVVVRAVRDRRARRPALAGFAVLVVAWTNIFFVTDLAGGEYARLMLPAAAVGRVAILWLFATALGSADVREPAENLAVSGPA